MKLSIIIPVYNVAEFLPNTIEHVLAQTFRDFELILVNNGSTDGSGEVCDRFAEKDNRIRVIHQENTGVSVARNTGVEAARGKYIGFTDSDDIIERDMYQVLLALAEKHGAEVAQCQHDRADTLNAMPRSEEVEIMDGEAFVRRMFTKQGGDYTNQVSLCTKVINRELFEGIKFPVGQVYEDEQETYKLCLKAKTIAETPDILYHYIKRENSIITGISAKKMLDKQAALLDRLHYLPARLPELDPECCEAFLRFSENILCQMYAAKETKAVERGVTVLLSQKQRLVPYLNSYEKLYLPALKWKCTRAWILKNEFAPVQKLLAKLKQRK